MSGLPQFWRRSRWPTNLVLSIPPVGRLWRTVRWLRPEQVLGRVRKVLWRPHPDLRPAPPLRLTQTDWILPARRSSSLLGPSTMRFLSVTHDLEKVGWDNPEIPMLWRYNQHYFDDLCARNAAERMAWHVALMHRWISEIPTAKGTGWAPYPTSLRVVNWIKWCRAIHAGNLPNAMWLDSLAVQVRWLAKNVEWHLLGNHLFANAKALVMAGLFHDGREADQWYAMGERILLRELPEQVLEDGGHFERSPLYHALAVEDVLDLLNALQAYNSPHGPALRNALAERVPAMLRWLGVMVGPNGSFTRFNDCADGIAPSTEELFRYATALGYGTDGTPAKTGGAIALKPSGYIRLDAQRATAWLDVAPIGPDYLPGHAHADTLACELVVDGHSVLVNRGTSVYGTGERRQIERGTAAHNTVTVAGRDSSEIWAGFRVGRRARVQGIFLQEASGVTTVKASHTGYVHLPGKPVHRRQWEWNSSDYFVVHDEIVARRAYGEWSARQPASVARYHLAPGLRVVQQSLVEWQVFLADQRLVTAQVQEGRAALEQWQHAVGFGELAHAWTIAVTLSPATRQARVLWSWSNPSISSS